MKVIGTIGRLEHRKGIDQLIRSISLLKSNVRLEIVGRNQSHYGKVLRKLRDDLKLQDRVVFKGELQREEVVVFLRRINVFALASREEGLGLVVLEAMKEGRCVVVSDIPAFRELVVHGRSGIVVTPPTTQKFARWFAWLGRNPVDRMRLGLEGRKRVREKFSKERMFEELERVYKEVGT